MHWVSRTDWHSLSTKSPKHSSPSMLGTPISSAGHFGVGGCDMLVSSLPCDRLSCAYRQVGQTFATRGGHKRAIAVRQDPRHGFLGNPSLLLPLTSTNFTTPIMMQHTLGLMWFFFAVFNNSYIVHHIALRYRIDPVSPSVVAPTIQIDLSSK